MVIPIMIGGLNKIMTIIHHSSSMLRWIIVLAYTKPEEEEEEIVYSHKNTSQSFDWITCSMYNTVIIYVK